MRDNDMELVINAISQLQSTVQNDNNRLYEAIQEQNKKLESIQCIQTKHQSDLDNCFNQVRDVEERVDEHDVKLVDLSNKVVVDNWKTRSLDDLRKNAIWALTAFLFLFCLRSCNNVKPAFNDTVKVITQGQVILRDAQGQILVDSLDHQKGK